MKGGRRRMGIFLGRESPPSLEGGVGWFTDSPAHPKARDGRHRVP